MKLHDSAIERLVKVFTTFGGHSDERRLKEVLQSIEFSEYQRKTGLKESILVLSEDLKK
jgi:hypothetical protein